MKKILYIIGMATCLVAFKGSSWKVTEMGSHHEAVYVVASGKNGQWLASGSNDNTVKIYNSFKKELVKELTCHSVGVAAIAFTSDGKTMITGGKDKLIRFWDTETWKRIGEIDEHTGQVNDLVVSSDDKYVYSCADDYKIMKWKIEDFSKAKEVGSHNSRVLSLCLSEDNKYLISTSGDKVSKSTGNLKVWNLASETLKFELLSEEYAVQDAVFDKSANLVFYAGNFSSIKVIKPSTGTQVMEKEVTKYGINTLAIDGFTVYAGSTFNGEITVWPIAGGDLVQFKAHEKDINSLVFHKGNIYSGGTKGALKYSIKP
ncbi:MAG: WD40 repeat domain-containing protein [Bacteroidetes bacterium]|nr:WD40 repeat domain-containing protein [Bacteroidota bacterium]